MNVTEAGCWRVIVGPRGDADELLNVSWSLELVHRCSSVSGVTDDDQLFRLVPTSTPTPSTVIRPRFLDGSTTPWTSPPTRRCSSETTPYNETIETCSRQSYNVNAATCAWDCSLACTPLSPLLWTPAQPKRASMLYFANVFYLFIYFFMAALFSGPG